MNKTKQYSHKEKVVNIQGNCRRGVSTLEAILLSIAILAGMVTMYPIVQQSINGRIKETVDTFSHGRQYEHYGTHKTNVTFTDNMCIYQCNHDCYVAVLGPMGEACFTGQAMCKLTPEAFNLINQCGTKCIVDRKCGGI